MAKPIGTLGTIDTLQIGGRIFTDLTNLIVLFSSVNSGTHATFLKTYPTQGTSGYSVTGGKTLTVQAIQLFSQTAVNAFNLLYNDIDVGFDSSTSFTNPVYFTSGSSSQNASIPNIFSASVTQNQFYYPFWRTPAGKFPSISWSSSNNQSAFGYGYET